MKLAFAIFFLTIFAPFISQAESRPTQYVVLAFDGSKSVPMWGETQDYTRDMIKAGKPLHFTYFINTAYFLADSFKKKYDAPGAGSGKSAIGFGGSLTDVLARYDQTNLAYQGGHEIANHAFGHFDGSKWSVSQWSSEFTQFYNLIEGFFNFNQTKGTKLFPNGWAFESNELNGFRAPQLGRNAAMFATLPKFGIVYDTSNTGKPADWPKKNAQGVWEFPLASIPIAGTAKKTLAMDYNFYFVQSGAKADPANADKYEEQMYKSYVAYFQSNYGGNRAPINIGHHFSKWNNGAYWNAMRRFANLVCGKSDVRCVTYRELVHTLNGTAPATLASYQNAVYSADKTLQLKEARDIVTYDLEIGVQKSEAGFDVKFTGKDARLLKQRGLTEVIYEINGSTVGARDFNIEEVRRRTAVGSEALVGVRVLHRGEEIQSATHVISQVNTAEELFHDQPEEAQALINDPPEAHDE